jgi:hypothetical protein
VKFPPLALSSGAGGLKLFFVTGRLGRFTLQMTETCLDIYSCAIGRRHIFSRKINCRRCQAKIRAAPFIPPKASPSGIRSHANSRFFGYFFRLCSELATPQPQNNNHRLVMLMAK